MDFRDPFGIIAREEREERARARTLEELQIEATRAQNLYSRRVMLATWVIAIATVLQVAFALIALLSRK